MLSLLKGTIQKRKRNRSYADLKDLQTTSSPFITEHVVRQDYSSNNVRLITVDLMFV